MKSVYLGDIPKIYMRIVSRVSPEAEDTEGIMGGDTRGTCRGRSGRVQTHVVALVAQARTRRVSRLGILRVSASRFKCHDMRPDPDTASICNVPYTLATSRISIRTHWITADTARTPVTRDVSRF